MIDQEPLKILLIEDDAGDSMLISYNLQSDKIPCSITQARSLEIAKQYLKQETFSVVLLDLFLPDSSGLATFEQIKNYSTEIPIIILSGLSDIEAASAAVSAGAQDFICKSEIDHRPIMQAIRYAIERFKLFNQLKQAEETAKLHSEEKSRFLAQLSHEIRTPMNGVIGMTNLLLQTQLTDEQQEMLSTIEKCGKNLLQLVSDILDLSKVQVGKLELEIQQFNIRDFIEETLTLFSGATASKDLIITDFIAPNVPSIIISDEKRLRQVLINLIGNAIKFTEQGYVFVRVQCLERNNQKLKLKFEVEDTGIGLSASAQRKLFQPFIQIKEDSLSKNIQGTGLGLAISKKIVELMNGEIGVIGSKGQGCTFWFTAVMEFVTQKYRPRADLSQTRVCILGDHERLAKTIQQQLSLRGIEQVSMFNLARATQIISQEPDILIIDAAVTKNKSVINIIKNIKEKKSDLQIILISTHNKTLLDGELKDHISAFMYLPLQQSNLYKKIAQNFEFLPPPPRLPQLRQIKSVTQDKKVKVLVVDDNLVNQKVALKMLHNLGYSAEAVGDGKKAISFLNDNHCDLVFMDCMMPELDGFETTKIIRQTARGKHIPIIALTAKAFDNDKQKCLEVGMNDFITKPITIDVVKSILDKWLNCA